ncbi:MAG: S53 family peptidase [Pseudomonadota bacterium]|nr:S53 family peptidase [Pseudomonadota bacterium]
MRTFLRALPKALLGSALFATMATAQAGHPYPGPKTPAPLDVGAMELARGVAPVTATVALKLRHVEDLQALAVAQHTPGSPQFGRFLTPEQFHARFDPSPDVVDAALAHFHQAGLAARLESGNLIRVSGSAQAIERAFGAPLHLYDVAAHGSSPGYRFHAPLRTPQVTSTAVAANVDAILGLDDRPRFRPRSQRAAGRPGVNALPGISIRKTPNTINASGDWTVSDFAQYYNVLPLYAQNVRGQGRTVGIVTLASFTPSDAFAYWSYIGLNVDTHRLTIVDVDGGPGAPSDDSGSDETTLDVEQSGGVAPAAKVIVYQAPNTDQAFYDAFVRAVNDNKAETVSVSWGEWEWFETRNTVTAGSHSLTFLRALENVLLQGAVQGQSFFAASGDSGAYDVNNPGVAPVPAFTKVLSVDSPASSRWITAAGGTTLPGDQLFQFRDGSTLTIKVPQERVWGWDYLIPLCNKLSLDPVACGIFPVGGGGGVSAYVPLPFYQLLVPTKTTEPNQTLVETSSHATYVTLPSHYRGRNLPDVSANADPDTGYIVVYTSSVDGGPFIYDFFGGTSFVAPQLNGVAALLGQKARRRLGLFNVPLYLAAATPLGYLGPNAPLRDIQAGDNWFYKGQPGYDQGSGVGVLDVANFSRTLQLLGY